MKKFITVLKMLCKPRERGVNRVKVLFRFFKWQIFEKPFAKNGKEINWIEERKLLVVPGRTVSTGNYYLGLLEWEEMSFLLHYAGSEDVFGDCGANIGIYSVLLGKQCKKVYAFEPSADTYKLLERNIEINGFTNVSAVRKGVGSKNEEIFFTKGLDTTNHIVKNAAGIEENVEKISVLKLDEYMKDKDAITILKIDVEGSEEKVLEGAGEILASQECNVVIMETFGDAKLTDILLEKGFLLYKYNPVNRELSAAGYDDIENNGIFIKDVNKAKARVKASRKIKVYDTWL